MGNCCKAKHTKELQGGPPAETRSCGYLTIHCPDCTSVQVFYSAEKPMYDVLEQLELPYTSYIIKKGSQVISDRTATLRELGVLETDSLILEKQPEVSEPSIICQSLEEIAEETTTKNQIGVIQPTSVRKVQLEREQGTARHLWETARSPSNNRQQLAYTQMDVSSYTNNPVDISMNERQIPAQFQVPVKLHAGPLEGDEYSGAKHQAGSFQDLHGPFSALTQFQQFR